MIKVGVIFGGESVEHEVSIISAIQAMNKMDSEKYEIVPIYITKDGEWFTGDFLKEVETFQDMSLIKKYAKNAVCSLTSRNIISGYDDGTFKPELQATRAMAAKIIYTALNTKGGSL